MTHFYNFSGGMESAAMLVLDRERIRQVNAIVRFADTKKHFPEMYDSIREIQLILDLPIVRIEPRITFEQFLYERGGMIRKGTNDCSRRMKRGNLSRHMKTFPRPYEVNIGFNVAEQDRADAFTARNERDWLHWRYPLIESNTSRDETVEICKLAGFSILVEMYKKMGRFDCFMCGNQRPAQALAVIENYPALAAEWMGMEDRKGHSFMPISLRVLAADHSSSSLFQNTGCSCFGADDDATGEGDES